MPPWGSCHAPGRSLRSNAMTCPAELRDDGDDAGAELHARHQAMVPVWRQRPRERKR